MATTSTARGTARVDLVVLAVITVVLRIPAYVADRHLTFDDGVYGASAVAMRAGAQPFRDVFSSQGPLFLPLVWAADVLGFRAANAPRVLSLIAGVALVGAVYVGGRAITDRFGALLAAGLVTTSASVLWVTGPVAADGAALALATATVALVLRWRREITVSRAVWLGVGVALTVSVKALLIPVALPVAMVLLAHRRIGPILAAASTAVGLHLLLWLPWGPADVWDQAYGYHLDVAGDRTPGRNLLKVISTAGDRDALVVAAVVLAAGATLLHRRARRPASEARPTSPDSLLLMWIAGTAVVLLTEHPLWRPHTSQLIPALALLAARHRPPLRALVVAAVLIVPYHLVHAWGILWPTSYAESTEQVIDALHALPPGALVISDDPGIVWRAGRLTTPDLVDASVLRIESGRITAESVAETAAVPDVCAVVVRSSVRWGSFDDLPERLEAEGFEVALEDDRGRRVYIDPSCGASG